MRKSFLWYIETNCITRCIRILEVGEYKSRSYKDDLEHLATLFLEGRKRLSGCDRKG